MRLYYFFPSHIIRCRIFFKLAVNPFYLCCNVNKHSQPICLAHCDFAAFRICLSVRFELNIALKRNTVFKTAFINNFITRRNTFFFRIFIGCTCIFQRTANIALPTADNHIYTRMCYEIRSNISPFNARNTVLYIKPPSDISVRIFHIKMQFPCRLIRIYAVFHTGYSAQAAETHIRKSGRTVKIAVFEKSPNLFQHIRRFYIISVSVFPSPQPFMIKPNIVMLFTSRNHCGKPAVAYRKSLKPILRRIFIFQYSFHIYNHSFPWFKAQNQV